MARTVISYALTLLSALILAGLMAQAEAAPPAGSGKKAAKKKTKIVKVQKAQPSPSKDLYRSRSDVMEQVPELAAATQLDSTWLSQVLGKAQYLPSVTRLILPPAAGVPKNWRGYRERFVEPIRINAGLMFWQTHTKALERAEKQYGVPAQYIVSIIGIETLYGRHTGNFRVLDTLTTLAFDFPREHPKAQARQAFFRDELKQFLILCHQQGMDPTSVKGSYAGAIGLSQFMPSSIARYAVDFDGDGTIDLRNSVEDAIGSVAHYFAAFRWESGVPTHFAVRIHPEQADLKTLLAPDILPTFDQASLQSKGVTLEPTGTVYPGKLALVELQNGEDAPVYVAGTDNFYAITRYNWSSYYAMAVIELGNALAQRKQQSSP